jgi:hypothetical protein
MTNYRVTRCNRALLEKLTVSQLVQPLPNPNYHYVLHKIPPLASILDQISSIHIFYTCFNTSLRSTHGCSKLSLPYSVKFCTNIYTMCHTSFDYLSNIIVSENCILRSFSSSGLNQWRTEGGFAPHSPKFLSFDKAEPNSQFRGKFDHNNLVKIQVSLICKLSGTPD